MIVQICQIRQIHPPRSIWIHCGFQGVGGGEGGRVGGGFGPSSISDPHLELGINAG